MKKKNNLANLPVIEAIEPRLLFSATMDVVLVDSQLEDQELLEAAALDVENYIVFDSERDSAQSIIEEVTRWAEEKNQTIDTLSIFSHGREGAFQLGSDTITTNTVNEQSFDLWEQLGQSFSDDANIYLYGCNVAGDGAGQELIDSIAEHSGADVFASDDITGAQGDWDLEVASSSAQLAEVNLSPINTSLLAAYSGSLLDTGWRAPGAVGETTGQWSNPLDALVSDNSRSEGTIGEVQDYRDFGIDVSSVTNPVIEGIEVTIEANTLFKTPGATVELSWDGGTSWTTGKTLSWTSNGFDQDRTAGSTSDSWGRQWTESELSDANFRVRITNTDSDFAPNEDLQVDSVSLRVTFVEDTAPVADTLNVVIDEDAVTAITLSGTDSDGGLDQTELYRIDTLPAPADGVLKLNGTAVTALDTVTQAEIDGGLLTFEPAANSNGATSFQFSANDGQLWSVAPATFSITVTPQNDAPVIDVPAAQTVTQNSALVFSSANSNALTVMSYDGDQLTVTLSVADGVLTLSQTTNLVFTAGDGASDTTMTFTGTQTDINNALEGLQFDPDLNFLGNVTVSLVAHDGVVTGDSPYDDDASAVARYTFDVDASDALGNHADGDLEEGAGTVVDGERGNVLYVDGSNDHVRLPASLTSGYSNFTMSFWVKTTENDDDSDFFDRPTLLGVDDDGIANEIIINTNNGYIGFGHALSSGGGDSQYTSTTTQINDNQWHLITVSNDGSNAVLYVDGQFEASLASGKSLGSAPLYLGAMNDEDKYFSSSHDQNHHEAFFDDLRFFSRALTVDEIGEQFLGLSDTASVAIKVNDDAVLANNALTINEGQTVTITAGILSATDTDDVDATLVFNVSSVAQGQFELASSPGVAITSFTQQQITDGDIVFVHNGGEIAPSYNVSVFDSHSNTVDQAAAITFNANMNDAPEMQNNSLTLNQGDTVVLTATEISANDVDNDNDTLTFTVTTVTNGQFEEVSSPGVAITSFTQLQLTSGDIQFVHDGSANAPAYSLTVGDGSLTSSTSASAIAFTAVGNDAPTTNVANAAGLEDAASVTITLSGNDNEAAVDKFRVTSLPANGTLYSDVGLTAEVAADDEFSATADAVDLYFVPDEHWDGVTTFQFAAIDDIGQVDLTPALATITITEVNDQPTAAALAIVDNEDAISVAITLTGADVDGTVDHFRLANLPANGTLYTDAGLTTAVVDNFNYAAAANSLTLYFDPDTNWEGVTQFQYFSIDDDAAFSAASATAQITLLAENDAPVISDNSLTINEGQTVVLSTSDIVVTDVDNGVGDFILNVSGVNHGQFELVASPGVAITSFTHTQLSSSAVQFVHDGGESAPTYNVTVFDGTDYSSILAVDATFSASVDDTAVLDTNSLTINEGQTVVITAAHIAASDVDTTDNTLRFDIGSVNNGQFELVASPGVAITNFTQQQVTDGDVQFVHDGGEVAPSYTVSVFDGSTSTTAQAASITFTASVDDSAVLGTNSLTVNEGQTVAVTASVLAATDVDTADNTLRFDIGSVNNGQFELVASPGVAITNFTQQQVTDGDVQFVHDGGEVAPSYTVSVFDGSTSTTAQAASITFTASVDDSAVLGTNSLTVNEGQTVAITAAHIAATDVDTADNTLRFDIGSVSNGQFELVASPGVAITNFTQQQVTDGDVQFVHDGGEVAPSYTVSVFDGSTSTTAQAASITFTASVDDSAVLGTNSLTVNEGQTVAITAAHIAASDVDTADNTLRFDIGSVSNGQFELVASPGVAITNFTQQQVTDGDVQFVHDGGETAASYTVSVFDGSTSTTAQAASITFTASVDDSAVLGTNSLTVNEGQTVTITAAHIAATDVDTADNTLRFDIGSVNNGQFELVVSPGVAITNFTQQQVTDGDVQFVHDGGEVAPSYTVSVFDGSTSTTAQTASITFTASVDDSAVLGTNSLTVNEGQTVAITAAHVAATDVDTADSTLRFDIGSVNNGQFELVASPGVAITNFTQQQVTDGDVQFVHDGGEVAPSYTVSVFDGSTSTTAQAASITFTASVDDSAVLGTNSLTVNEGQTVAITAAHVAATDVDTADNTLRFDIGSVSNGQFELVASPGVAITNFTQQQVTDGDVQFVHDGGEVAPSYTVSVFDGSTSTTAQAASITFSLTDDSAVLGTNSLTVNEGQAVTITAAHFAATDVDTADNTLRFDIGSVNNGQFELIASPGVAITNFTQQQVTDGDVQFVHDGGEVAPSYTVSVFDGSTSTTAQAASISFAANANDTPVALAYSVPALSEGFLSHSIDLNALFSDEETSDANLIFSVSGENNLSVVIENGQAIVTPLSSEWHGLEALTFTAEDEGGATASLVANFVVDEINDLPQVSTLEDQVLERGFESYSIDLKEIISDIDTPFNDLVISVRGGENIQVVADDNGLATISAASDLWVGNEAITFVVKDSSGETVEFTTNFVVTPPATILTPSLLQEEEIETTNSTEESEPQTQEQQDDDDTAIASVSSGLTEVEAQEQADESSEEAANEAVEDITETASVSDIELRDFLAVNDVVREIESLNFSSVIDLDDDDRAVVKTQSINTLKAFKQQLSNPFSSNFFGRGMDLGWLPDNAQLWQELDDVERHVDEDYESGETLVQTVKGAGAASLSIVGAWFLRAAALGSSMFASMPMWRTIDPVVVLNKVDTEDDKIDDDQDDIEPMFTHMSAR